MHTNASGYCYRHDYILAVTLRNDTSKTLRDWNISLEVPIAIVDEKYGHEHHRTYRRTSDDAHRVLYPGDEETFEISYRVDDDIYKRKFDIFPQVVRAKAYAHGELVGECTKHVEEIQEF